MQQIFRGKNFYVILLKDEIKFGEKYNGVTTYPKWLGKNRAVMRNAQKAIRKDPPKTVIDFLHYVGHFELAGAHAHGESVDKSLFLNQDK